MKVGSKSVYEPQLIRSSVQFLLMVLMVSTCVNCSKNPSNISPAIKTEEISALPNLKKSTSNYIAPLAEVLSKLDPKIDGWETESFSESASSKLKKIAKKLANPSTLTSDDLSQYFQTGAKFQIIPKDLIQKYENEMFSVSSASTFNFSKHNNPGLVFQELLQTVSEHEIVDSEIKLFKVDTTQEKQLIDTHVYFHATGLFPSGRRQLNSEWLISWSKDEEQNKITSIKAINHEEVTLQIKDSKPLFSDATSSVLGKNKSYKNHLLYSSDHWRSRLTRDLGLDAIAHHGISMGDINGDMLEDIYLCQQGGLPNRLFIQNPDGTLTDFSHQSKSDWLDFSTSAIFSDFDNDGDQDLVVSLDFRIVFMANNGGGEFKLVHEHLTQAQIFSLAVTDYDKDGDLDLFACGYNGSTDPSKTISMGEPVPYHDAKNGGPNILLEQISKWRFIDATEKSGLNQNNNRFSFAATWIDFDQDGDQDLYVANDYGRNNLYLNQGDKFEDVANKLGVEDMSSGMSVDWADLNRDGALDFYISNMFSAAGNRITFQRQFRPDFDVNVRKAYQRHARGNSLFLGNSNATGFKDVSEEMGVTMGRWAWGSRFVDVNNDGWEDIVVANGFITTEDTGDL